MRYSESDKLLKAYLENDYGKRAARMWIKYPKDVLFSLLACFHNHECCEEKIRDAVKNDEDYVLRAVFGVKVPFTMDFSKRF